MIDYVKGTLAEKDPSWAVVEAAGVGYYIEIPLLTFEALPNVGDQAKLFTHHHVREDAVRLFGFASKGERELFRQLISISQIGPKVGLNVLSNLSVGELVSVVAASDVGRLKSIPGVGLKTAQRLVMELKGKLKGVDASQGAPVAPGTSGRVLPVKVEACQALVSLGYSDREVKAALDRVETSVAPEAGIETWIRKALQVI